MANLLNQINQDLVVAQKGRDKVKVSTLRFLLSNVKNAEIEKRAELSDEEVVLQVQKDAKRHKESIEAFRKAGRDDLLGKEKTELEILSKYLPAQLSREEVERVVNEVIEVSGASSPADMGKVMGQVMGKVGAQADGVVVSQLVRDKLSS